MLAHRWRQKRDSSPAIMQPARMRCGSPGRALRSQLQLFATRQRIAQAMSPHGASLPRENACVAAAMWGRADSPSRHEAAQYSLPRPRGRVDQGARLPGAVSAASAKVAPLRNKTPRPEITSGAFLSANQSPLLAQSSRLTILDTSLVRCAISENRRAL